MTITLSLAPDGTSLQADGVTLPSDPAEAIAALHEALKSPLFGDARIRSEAPPEQAAERSGAPRPRDGRTITSYPDGTTVRVIQPTSRKISRREISLEDLGLGEGATFEIPA